MTVPDSIALRLEPSLRELLAKIAAFFEARGLEAYATGGFLRDALLGLPTRDLDISISADPLELGPQLADAFEGDYFPLDEERGHARILLPAHDLRVDLLPLRGAIEDDLRGRDYTVNALAASLTDAAAAGPLGLIDPTGGLDDLRAGVIRLIREQALFNDPLRLLRGVRLAAQLDFRIEPATAELIHQHAALLRGVAVERQRDELMLVLSTRRAAKGLWLLDELGLLRQLLPELDVTRDVEQPKEHHWDVFGHSLAAVDALDTLLAEDEPVADPQRRQWRELWTQLAWWDGAREHLRSEVVAGVPRSAVLKLGALLHDIGKPETRSLEESGRIRFFGHADVGAEIAVRFMRRLRFSSAETSLVGAMIEAHLRPLLMAHTGTPTDRAIYRFFRDTGEAGIDTLFLSLADHLGTVGPRFDLEGWRRHVALMSYLLFKRFNKPEITSPPKLIDGDDLMAALGLSPGPQIGELLELVREAHAAGEVATKEEALELAKAHLHRTRKRPLPARSEALEG